MKNIHRKRIHALRARLQKEKIDGLLVVTIEDSSKNVRYLTGFGGTTGALLITRKEAVLVVDPRYTLRAEREALGVRVAEIKKDLKKKADFISYTASALQELHISKKSRIGFESNRVSYAMAGVWKKELSCKLVPTKGMVEQERQVKDAEEIRLLSRAGKMTVQAFMAVEKRIRAGQTEREVAQIIDSELRKQGALKNSFDTIVASGANSAIPHHETGNRRLKAGDPVVLDFGGVFDGGYCSDITRTIFVPGKKPHAKLMRIYTIVREANAKAFRALTSGMTWKEYDAVAREYITEKGYGAYFTHGLGHSVGLETHDPYNYAHDAFLPGTVMSNEPGIYIPNLGGVRIEDDVLITKKGARNLTPAPYLSL
ncbi:Xaa-Pro peptidase family protein [Patescibacteria group bacterium]|nr:Xaa-Pro peptidase family protein [Patescibacteria group bacterium]